MNAVAVRFHASDFKGKDSEKTVWRKFGELLPSVSAKLRRDPSLRDFASSAYVSRYWKRGTGEKRFPWIGFVHKNHLNEFGDREYCAQFQYGPNFWSIWIDYPASKARHYANENLERFSDSSLRRYFNSLGDNFAKKVGYDALVSLYPHPDRRASDMNDFERRLYGKYDYWEESMINLDDSQTHQFVVGVKQPETGVYIGAEISNSELIALSKKGTIVREMFKVTKALLPLYLFMTGIEVPKGLREGKKHANRGGGHVLTTTSIDESARWAVERAMQYERDQGRVPEDVSSQIVHYDLESRDKDGHLVRLIEVKGRRSHIPVVLTSGEYKEAQRRKKDYFLYVITGDHEGFAIQDPASACKSEEREVQVYDLKDWKEKAQQFSI